MKLLLCLKCDDVFNLDYQLKTCRCGETQGHYVDKVQAVYSGEKAIPLVFDNFSFADAIRRQPSKDSILGGQKFTAVVVPKECQTFVKKIPRRGEK